MHTGGNDLKMIDSLSEIRNTTEIRSYSFVYEVIQYFTLGTRVAILWPSEGVTIEVKQCVLLLDAKPWLACLSCLHGFDALLAFVGLCKKKKHYQKFAKHIVSYFVTFVQRLAYSGHACIFRDSVGKQKYFVSIVLPGSFL